MSYLSSGRRFSFFAASCIGSLCRGLSAPIGQIRDVGGGGLQLQRLVICPDVSAQANVLSSSVDVHHVAKVLRFLAPKNV